MNALKRIIRARISMFFLCLLFGSYTLWSQINNGFTKLTTKEGISQNTIHVMLQDTSGFMWFGTNDGLNKYDGYNFISYKNNEQNLNSISHNFIEALIEDHQGNLWIGTNGGLNKFNPTTATFTRFDTAQIGAIKSLYQDHEHRLWIGTRDNGLYLINLNTLQVESYQKNASTTTIFSITEDKLGNLWVVNSYGLGKLRKNTNTIIYYKTFNTNADQKLKLFKDNNGDLWFGGYEHRLWKYNYEGDEFVQLQFEFHDPTSFPGERIITSITEDQNGFLWLGTWSSGIIRINKTTGEYKHFNADPDDPKALSYNQCWQVFIDRDNLLWVGTHGQGINKLVLNNNGISIYQKTWRGKPGLVGSSVKGIHEDDRGRLWVGTYGGFNIINRKTGKIKQIPYNSSILASAVIRILPDRANKNEVWLGTHMMGLYKLNTLTGRIEHKLQKEVKPNVIFTMVQDTLGDLWLGGYEGLYHYNVHQERYTTLFGNNKSTTPFSKIIVRKLFLDNNTLWIGTQNKGLIKYNVMTGTHKRYIIPSTRENIPIEIQEIYKSHNGTIWIGTDSKGLNKFSPQEEKFISYTENHGLPSNTVYGILEDDENYLWLSTNKGISKFNPLNNSIKNFTVADGLQDLEFNFGSYYKSNSGELFFGGKEGLNSFFPKQITYNSTIPKIAITSMKSYGRPITYVQHLNTTNAIQLNYQQDELEFEFSSLSFTDPELHQYAYKLEGVDEDWTFSGSRRFVTYSHLAPGIYEFKVKGTNSYGVWNEAGVTLPIYITPPFWATTTFYIAITILIMSFITYVIYNVRQKQLRLSASNEEKEAIIKEIHHRIKNNLGVVNSLLKLQSREIEDEKVVAIFKEAQNRVISMALLHEKMYRSDDLQHIDVREHIKLLIEDLLKSYKIDKKINLDLRIDRVEFGMRTLVPLGLIINEIITNALKYAFKNRTEGRITVWLKKHTKESYQLTIGDNGIGLNEGTKKATGMGTRLIQSFIRQLKGTIKRLDQPGTLFQIDFKNIGE